jgi:Family of unknown function (DUF6788)
MPPTNTAERLADYEQRYRELAAELATIGLIHSGSVTRRYTRCATPGCKCHADPPQPHGPYFQWTAKINGKTVTRRLSESEAKLYQEWIANDRRLRRLIEQMRQIAAKAAELKLKQAADPSPRTPHPNTHTDNQATTRRQPTKP